MLVVGESSSVEELLKQAEETPACVVLLDWELPGLRLNGTIATLRRAIPKTRLIALSGRPEAVVESRRAGIDAFVCKGDSPETLLDTLRALCETLPTQQQTDQHPVRQVRGQEALEIVEQTVQQPGHQAAQQRRAN